MNPKKIFELRDRILDGGPAATHDEANELIFTADDDLMDLIAAASRIRTTFCKQRVELCSIVNAKSNACSENCNFCAQSAHYPTATQTYPLMEPQQIVEKGREARETMQASHFSIVTAWRGPRPGKDFEKVKETIREMSAQVDVGKCTSLGILPNDQMAHELRDAGLNYYHHNLETAESYFDKVCTSHTFQDRVKTIKHARAAGLTVCSGGLFGLGESPEQRVELAMTLQELDVTSVPINILHPIEGTPQHQHHEPLRPMDILKIIATYRFALPRADIGVFGGREMNLRDLQSWVFPAGANMILIGNYLTTKGRKAEDDLQMLDDLGLWINHEGHHGSHAAALGEIRQKMNGGPSARSNGHANSSQPAAPSESSFRPLTVLG